MTLSGMKRYLGLCILLGLLLSLPKGVNAQYPIYSTYYPPYYGYRVYIINNYNSNPGYRSAYEMGYIPPMQYKLTPYRERVMRNRVYMTFGPKKDK